MFVNRYSVRNFALRFGGSRPLRILSLPGRVRWSTRRPALGIEVRGSTLHLACVRKGLGRRWLVGTDTIPDFLSLAAEELRSHLRKLLAQWGAEDPVVVVGLPRRDVIVRHLALPSAAENSLDEALLLQLSAFKPNDEDEFCSDAVAVRQGGPFAASLVLLPRPRLETLVAKFLEAACPIARVTLTQFALVDLALRGTAPQRPPRFLLVHQRSSEADIAAIQGCALLYSRSVSLPSGNPAASAQLLAAVDESLAGLRWTMPVPVLLAGSLSPESEQELARVGTLHRFPDWLGTAEWAGAQPEDFRGATALAVDGGEWFASYRLNLLPAELRARRSRWGHLPTYLLVAANALLLLALGLRGPVQRRILLRQYQSAIASFQAPAARSEVQLQREKLLRQRLGWMLQFREQGRRPLDLLVDVTGKLPSDAWLNFFTYRSGVVEIDGAAKSASAVLSSLQSLAGVADVKFAGALTRDDSGLEHFRIQMRVKENR